MFTNYYYLNDESGKRVKEYKRSRKLYDSLTFTDYTTEQHKDNFDIYEYDDNYEIIFIDDTEVFYFSASKNKRTQYSIEDITETAKNHLQNLRALSDK